MAQKFLVALLSTLEVFFGSGQEQVCLLQGANKLQKVAGDVNTQAHIDEVPTVGSSVSMHSVSSSDAQISKHVAAEPNGPLLMNKTKMDQDLLGKASKHENAKTMTADWQQEYQPLAIVDQKSGAWFRSLSSIAILTAALATNA
eukprot:CAMPEP_0169137450 /NCGR_PEP_ID=MMETSP1015-20121227/41550_1 /TAXON_ID=342587 /ORGANISM="Karlodinium micrum, Strain CCMP2283" /LENGTH=143 /DNA_ID=CAMNT_0009202305 /DNA_START=45 /DNA_END=476 /DNA_ORIENTATION=-